MKRSIGVFGGLLLSVQVLNAQAITLSSNFHPASLTPDHSTTASADLAGDCIDSRCSWINAHPEGFSFTPMVTGTASLANQLLLTTHPYPVAEHIYGQAVTDSVGQVLARGGDSGRNVPIGAAQGYEFDIFANSSAGQSVTNGVLSPTVTIPAVAWLLGPGLLGLVGVARRH